MLVEDVKGRDLKSTLMLDLHLHLHLDLDMDLNCYCCESVLLVVQKRNLLWGMVMMEESGC